MIVSKVTDSHVWSYKVGETPHTPLFLWWQASLILELDGGKCICSGSALHVSVLSTVPCLLIVYLSLNAIYAQEYIKYSLHELLVIVLMPQNWIFNQKAPRQHNLSAVVRPLGSLCINLPAGKWLRRHRERKQMWECRAGIQVRWGRDLHNPSLPSLFATNADHFPRSLTRWNLPYPCRKPPSATVIIVTEMLLSPTIMNESIALAGCYHAMLAKGLALFQMLIIWLLCYQAAKNTVPTGQQTQVKLEEWDFVFTRTITDAQSLWILALTAPRYLSLTVAPSICHKSLQSSLLQSLDLKHRLSTFGIIWPHLLVFDSNIQPTYQNSQTNW